MAYIIKGQSFSYDYSDLLEDIREDLADGILSESTIIHIVRGEQVQLTDTDVYRPIIDYYMPRDLQHLQESIECAHDQAMIDLLSASIEQYKADESRFEAASVLAVLTELNLWNELFP